MKNLVEVKDYFKGIIDDDKNASVYRSTDAQIKKWTSEYEIRYFNLGKGEAYFLCKGNEIKGIKLFKGDEDVSNKVVSSKQRQNLYNKYLSLAKHEIIHI